MGILWPIIVAVTVLLQGKAGAQLSEHLVPYSGCLYGSSAKPQPPDTDYDQAMYTLEGKIGRQVDIAHRYHSYMSFRSTFPTDYEQRWSDEGRLLLINWYPPGTWAEAASGQYDAMYIDPTAQNMAAWDRRFFLILSHEPDNNVGPPGSGMTTSDYVDMWQHVRARFDAAGADKIVWVWNMTAWIGNRDNWNPMYPGDYYVDWIAFDPYNWVCPEDPGNWRSFTTTCQTFLDWVVNDFVGDRTKPIMIAETGCGENPDPDGPTKEEWFRSLPAELMALPQIKAFVYWNSEQGCQFYVDTSPAALAGFQEAVSHPYLNSDLTQTVPPDFDLDGDVDQEDFGHVQECFSGTGIPSPVAGCADADFNSDNDVDLDDLNQFLNCMNGANVPSDC
ncbi:MAG: glycoside hydrolase family 26 protein [Planctomycetota bacterium]|jgi:hypothetical protein